MTAATCEVCRNAAAVIVISDAEHTERAACRECWHQMERAMDVRVVRFPAPYGVRTRA